MDAKTPRTTPILIALGIVWVVAMGIVALLITHPPVPAEPTVPPPVPAVDATQTQALSARPSPTPAPSSTPTDAPTATAAATPLPTPAPQFGAIAFGAAVQGDQLLDRAVQFYQVHVVYALASYGGMRAGMPYTERWYLDDGLWSEQERQWDIDHYGSDGPAYVADTTPFGAEVLSPGKYRFELSIEGRSVQAATFVVLAPTPTPVPPTPTPMPSIRELGRRAARSLVALWVPNDRLFGDTIGGSGSIVDGARGLIVTNWHVVGDWAGRLWNEEGHVRVYTIDDPDAQPIWTYWAQVMPEFCDPELDVAVLRITHRASDGAPVNTQLDLTSVPMGSSAAVRIGDPVLLLGFPDYAGGSVSWTEGVVATRDEEWIKSDAGISHGHSGGMLLNTRGELIGIPSQYEPTSSGGVLARSLPIDGVRPWVDAARAAMGAPSPSTPSPGGTSPGEIMVVLGAGELNLRDTPSLDGEQIDTMILGTRVEVLRDPAWDGERLWYYVRAEGSGVMGWASERYLAPLAVASAPILFYSDRAGSVDIYRMLPDGTGTARLTTDPGDEGDARWSPDGQQIVFSGNRAGDADLFLMGASGGQWTALTIDPADEIHPAWSRDGSRIAYVSDRDGDWEIYVIDLGSRAIRQVTFNDAWDSYPTWSPDGTQIAYTSRQEGNYDLYLVDLPTGVTQRLTTNAYTDMQPAWAPYGDEIAYTTVIRQGGRLRKEIAVLNVRYPGQLRLVTDSGPGDALNTQPAWSPDGRWIVFSSDRDGDREVYIVPAVGGLTMNLTDAPGSNDGAPDWSP
ncbi:MAG: PD40 domain-containing protein [Anaerolineae bacterium]|nr:PD40 domain-containing protein [Anaerolineae bacterium]